MLQTRNSTTSAEAACTEKTKNGSWIISQSESIVGVPNLCITEQEVSAAMKAAALKDDEVLEKPAQIENLKVRSCDSQELQNLLTPAHPPLGLS